MEWLYITGLPYAKGRFIPFICSVKTDYLIIGQGICGTLLSYELVQGGNNVHVIDAGNPAASSRVASGLINPVTGKRVVASWMIDELLPVAVETYEALEKLLGTPLLTRYDILEFDRAPEEKEAFEKRETEGSPYIIADAGHVAETSFFNYYFGTGKIKGPMLVNLPALLNGWRNELVKRNALSEEMFMPEDLVVKDDGVHYRGIEAKKIILCNGVNGFGNPWFSKLPFSLNKGEVLIASIPGLPRNCIYKQGIKIVPVEDELFWIGASYEWKYEHPQPTEQFRERTEAQLKNWLKLPFEITGHIAAERPSTVDYKPFAGFHPLYPQIGILNGMGSKGCSQAPYFARQLARCLSGDGEILPDADVRRFSKVLSR